MENKFNKIYKSDVACAKASGRELTLRKNERMVEDIDI